MNFKRNKDKFERNMRLKMDELNNNETEIRSQNVQLERELILYKIM